MIATKKVMRVIRMNRKESVLLIKKKTTMAGRPGFEPGLLGPEPRVLPLNYLP